MMPTSIAKTKTTSTLLKMISLPPGKGGQPPFSIIWIYDFLNPMNPDFIAWAESLEASTGLPVIRYQGKNVLKKLLSEKHMIAQTANALVVVSGHGSPGNISLSKRKSIPMLEFLFATRGAFKEKSLYLSTCSTFNVPDEELQLWKRLSGARLMLGYKADITRDAAALIDHEIITLLATAASSSSTTKQLAARSKLKMLY